MFIFSFSALHLPSASFVCSWIWLVKLIRMCNCGVQVSCFKTNCAYNSTAHTMVDTCNSFFSVGTVILIFLTIILLLTCLKSVIGVLVMISLYQFSCLWQNLFTRRLENFQILHYDSLHWVFCFDLHEKCESLLWSVCGWPADCPAVAKKTLQFSQTLQMW